MLEVSDAFSPFVWAGAISAALSEIWGQLVLLAVLLTALELALAGVCMLAFRRTARPADATLLLTNVVDDGVLVLTNRVSDQQLFAHLADQMAACLSDARGDCCAVLPMRIFLAAKPIPVPTNASVCFPISGPSLLACAQFARAA